MSAECVFDAVVESLNRNEGEWSLEHCHYWTYLERGKVKIQKDGSLSFDGVEIRIGFFKRRQLREMFNRVICRRAHFNVICDLRKESQA